MNWEGNYPLSVNKKVLHLISQAHLDPVWLWPEQDGIGEALNTMRSASAIAWETKEFKFTRSSAATYRCAKENDPQLFREIKTVFSA